MKNSKEYILYLLVAVAGLLCSCSETDLTGLPGELAENRIRIGGIDTDGMIVSSSTTRAGGVPAETVPWLLQPLKAGLDITYGLYNVTPNHQDVAILKLVDSNSEDNVPYATQDGLAVYTFKYRADRKSEVGVDNDAIWYNNGSHYFQGVHVPERIRYESAVSEVETKAPGLTADQHDDETEDTGGKKLGNYTLLSHYLGMPANYRLTATVERIMLPFRHRLARVVAFVLIDPELHTTLKGYKKAADGKTDVTNEDPNNTSIRFCNVKVLQGVKDETETGGHHNLTPTWKKERKVIPHFDGERGSYSYKTLESFDEYFKLYTKDADGKADALYPTSTNWKAVHDATNHNGYTEVNYGKVPVYDIIVRPTYTNEENVMYDEDLGEKSKADFAKEINSIDFEIELANGLRYEKTFEFDLNANYQTVVYLRISREHVDYNDAGSDMWIEERNNDGWYGVDNKNGNTLSFAGSSWQRAYTYGQDFTETPNTTDGVTDGHFYNSTSSADEREKAQYFTSEYQNIWVEKFLQAYKDGKHHGDYFVLRSDITIDVSQMPLDFVFTGHLDAQDHTITLTGTDSWVECTNEVLNKLYQSKTDGDKVPPLYVVNEIAQAPPRQSSTRAIEFQEPEAVNMDATKPGDLRTDLVYLYKDDNDDYQVYYNRKFYKKTPSFLFAGLNGTYSTKQEADPSIPANQWEANVHKETNKSTVWVPTAGYRAEVLNTVIKDGSLFPVNPENGTITGNVQNCYYYAKDAEGNEKKIPVTYTPNIPQYK